MNKLKVIEINQDYILFDNGVFLISDHEQD